MKTSQYVSEYRSYEDHANAYPPALDFSTGHLG